MKPLPDANGPPDPRERTLMFMVKVTVDIGDDEEDAVREKTREIEKAVADSDVEYQGWENA